MINPTNSPADGERRECLAVCTSRAYNARQLRQNWRKIFLIVLGGRFGILWERFECYLTAARRGLVIGIAHVLSQRSAQNVVILCGAIFALSPINASLEVKPDIVDGLSGEGKCVALQLTLFEKVIEKDTAIA